MNKTLIIAKRELTSLFYSPIAYVVLGVFALGATLIFMNNFGPGQAATLRPTFDGIIWLMILVVPGISMRLISEEVRSGTVELLMTTPLDDITVIMGKWLGALAFFGTLMIPLIALWFVLEMNGDPDPGPIITGIVGLVLVGAFYLAIGTFASAITQNQIIAFFVTVMIIALLTLLMYFLPRAEFVGPGLQQAMFYMNVNMQFDDFNKGLLDTSNFVYFISGTALFLFLAVKTLESRRWR